jgi:shikimate kinase
MTARFPGDLKRSVVFIGLMGAGKSCIGRRLAQRLELPFADADAEIEKAANLTVQEIFDLHGEAQFRDGERRVIRRLLSEGPKVIATGGGAYMNPRTRALIAEEGISVWIRAPLSLLVKRTARRDSRPLLKRGDPRKILEDLITERHPVYADADVTVDSIDGPPDVTVNGTLDALTRYVAAHPEKLEQGPPREPALQLEPTK